MSQDNARPALTPTAERLGRALKRLRHQVDMSQEDAGARLGISAASWGKYELAKNKALLNPAIQARAAEALGQTRDQLLALAQTDTSTPVALFPMTQRAASPFDNAPPQRLVIAAEIRHYGPEDTFPWSTDEPEPVDLTALINNPQLRSLRVMNDDIAPFAEQGMFVAYDLNGIPRKGQYVIVRLRSHDVMARRFIRRDGEAFLLGKSRTVAIEGGVAWAETVESLTRAEIEGLYPIRLQGE